MAVAAAGLALAGAAYADLAVEDYAPTAGAVSPAEQAQLARQIEAEQKAAAERMRREREEAERKAAAERAQLDARPYPERLTAARCTRCHAAGMYLEQRHTRIGWSLVTLRMKFLNGAAEISEAERDVIVRYMAAQAGAGGTEAAKEYDVVAAAAGMPFAVAGVVAGWRRYRRKDKETRPK